MRASKGIGSTTSLDDYNFLEIVSFSHELSKEEKLSCDGFVFAGPASIDEIDPRSMFGGATSFNQPLNNWNVSKVKEMYGMFHEASSFNQPLNEWNVSNVADMSAMFKWATSFNQSLDEWDVSNDVTSMVGMFHHASSFNQLLHAPWAPLK